MKKYEIALLLVVFIILVFIVVTNSKNNLKRQCVDAICNEDNTICYKYATDSNGKNKKIWEGNCSKLK